MTVHWKMVKNANCNPRKFFTPLPHPHPEKNKRNGFWMIFFPGGKGDGWGVGVVGFINMEFCCSFCFTNLEYWWSRISLFGHVCLCARVQHLLQVICFKKMSASPVASCAAGLLLSVFDAVVNLLLVGDGWGGGGGGVCRAWGRSIKAAN